MANRRTHGFTPGQAVIPIPTAGARPFTEEFVATDITGVEAATIAMDMAGFTNLSSMPTGRHSIIRSGSSRSKTDASSGSSSFTLREFGINLEPARPRAGGHKSLAFSYRLKG